MSESETETAVQNLVAAGDKIGLALLQNKLGGNLTVSPASVQIILAILSEGARGETLSALETTLGAGGTVRQNGLNELLALVNQYSGDPAVVQEKELPEYPVLHLANNLVLDESFEVNRQYLDLLNTQYGSEAQVADLMSARNKKMLDAWVYKNSGGLISKSEIQPGPDQKLVLQNAVLLAARWQYPFSYGDTGHKPFHLLDGSTIWANTMSDSFAVKHAEINGWQAVRLPYTAGFYADIVLPPVGTDPRSLSISDLGAVNAQLKTASAQKFQIFLPKFKTKAKFELGESLAALDLDIITDFNRADFSGISPQKELALGQAIQQTVLQVDEDGTVAVAITEIMLKCAAYMEEEVIPEFVVDHPFLLRIGQNETDWTLFLAAINDPS